MDSAAQSLQQQQSEPTNAAPSFTCTICGKKFDQKRPQIRHLSYCRKSKTRPPKSRKKACVLCTKAKTECEVRSAANGRLQCTRCQKKGVDCHFERPSFVDTPASDSPPNTVESALEISTDSLSRSKDTPIEHLTSTGEVVELSNYQLARPNSHDISSGGNISAVELLHVSNRTQFSINPWNESINSDSYEQLLSEDFSFQPGTPRYFLHGKGRNFLPYINEAVGLGAPFFNQILLKPKKAFFPRGEYDKMQLTRKYVVSVMKSYPNMLLENKLPLFIHHSCASGELGSTMDMSMPRSLSICVGIIQMFSVKNRNNIAFIWKTIRMEQERLAAECSQFDDAEILAGLQAVSIYMLLRISEEDEDATDFDIPLIKTMLELALRTNGFVARYSSPSNDAKRSWKNWALAESVIRTLTLICLIDLLFDLSEGLIPHHCDGSQFRNLTLPCSKNLWNASSELEWERKLDSQPHGLDPANRLTYGNIMEFQVGIDNCGKRLDNWLCNMDDFGTLIVAASSLTGRMQRVFGNFD